MRQEPVRKYRWTREDNRRVTLGFLEGKTAEELYMVGSGPSLRSIRMKLANCRFLQGGDAGLSHVSRMHREVWNEIMAERAPPPENDEDRVADAFARLQVDDLVPPA